jgi:hypothetical protein
MTVRITDDEMALEMNGHVVVATRDSVHVAGDGRKPGLVSAYAHPGADRDARRGDPARRRPG